MKFFNKTKKKERISLPNVTLVAVSSIKIAQTVYAIKKSMQGIDFGEVIFISHKKPFWINNKIKFERCEPIRSLDAYSKFMIYDLMKFIKTDYALVVQYDGFVLRPEKWNKEFLKYDYIGAPWPKNKIINNKGENIRVGNGGFSLRSKKLLNIFNDLRLPFSHHGYNNLNEDGMISVYYRKEIERAGIKFAPVNIASMFSHENDCDDSYEQPFGFHKNKK